MRPLLRLAYRAILCLHPHAFRAEFGVPADVFSVIVNPGPEVSTSFDAGVTTPGVGFGAGSGAGTLPTLNDPLSEIGCTSQM